MLEKRLLQKLVDINFERQYKLLLEGRKTEFYAYDFVTEYQTITFDVGRQQGKTTNAFYLGEKYKTLLLSKNFEFLRYLERYRHCPPTNKEISYVLHNAVYKFGHNVDFVNLNSRDAFIAIPFNKYDCIVIDNFSCVKNLENIFGYCAIREVLRDSLMPKVLIKLG